jgi:hypothetical protein
VFQIFMQIPEEPLATLRVRHLGQLGHGPFSTRCHRVHEITTLPFIQRQFGTFVIFVRLGKWHHQTPASLTKLSP